MSEKLVAKTKAAMEQQFDLNLIEAVRLNPVIYDRSHFNYKHNMRKAQHWKQISEELGVHEQKCIKRWKSLRDKFAREMKISSESRWRYFKKMSFLVEYIRQYRESLLGKCGPLPTTQTTTTTTTQVTQVESNQQQQQQQQHQQQQQTQPQSQQQQTQPQSQQQTQQPQTQQQQQPQVQQQCLVDIFPFHGAATTSTQAVHHPHVTGDTQLTTVTTAPPKDQKSFCYEPPMKRKRFDDEQQLQLQQQQQLLLQQQQQLQQHNDSMLNTKFQNSLSQGVCPEDQSFGVAVTDMLNTLGVKQKAEAKVHIVKYLTDMKFLAQHRKF